MCVCLLFWFVTLCCGLWLVCPEYISRAVCSICLTYPQGVECFAYDSDLTVLATGGMDHAVRLWNPYVTSKPIAYFQQHATTVLDLVMYRDLGLLFSYSQNGVGRQRTHTCTHTHTHTHSTPPPHTPETHTPHKHTHIQTLQWHSLCEMSCMPPPSHTSHKHTKTTVKRVPSGSLLLISPRNTVALTGNKIMLRMITIG